MFDLMSTRANRKKKSPARPMTVTWAVLIGIFVLELLFYAWCRVQCINTGYQIDAQLQRRKRLTGLQNELKVELTQLKAPARIRQLAENRLGLIMPGPEKTVILP